MGEVSSVGSAKWSDEAFHNNTETMKDLLFFARLCHDHMSRTEKIVSFLQLCFIKFGKSIPILAHPLLLLIAAFIFSREATKRTNEEHAAELLEERKMEEEEELLREYERSLRQ